MEKKSQKLEKKKNDISGSLSLSLSLSSSLGFPFSFVVAGIVFLKNNLTCAGGTRPYPARYAGLPSAREARACWRSRAKPLNVPETMSLQEDDFFFFKREGGREGNQREEVFFFPERETERIR